MSCHIAVRTMPVVLYVNRIINDINIIYDRSCVRAFVRACVVCVGACVGVLVCGCVGVYSTQ